MAVKYFVKAAVSEYLDNKTNTTKKKYQSIGVVMETKHGLMLKIETLPLFDIDNKFDLEKPELFLSNDVMKVLFGNFGCLLSALNSKICGGSKKQAF